jgi:hypothetical protein
MYDAFHLMVKIELIIPGGDFIQSQCSFEEINPKTGRSMGSQPSSTEAGRSEN